jgi:hypothetical protein
VRWSSGNIKVGAAGASLNFSNGGFHWRAGGPGLSGPGILSNLGLLLLECGDACSIFEGGTFNNAGTVRWTNNTGYRLAGTINNLAGGVIELQGYTQIILVPNVIVVGQVNNAGTLTTTAGTVVSNWNANLGNSGLVHLAHGKLSLSGANGFTQTSTGTLEIELNAAGVHTLQVTNKATLAGTLKVTLNGVTPNLGDQFELVTYGSRDGQFATLELPNAGAGQKFDVVYEANRVLLKVVAP